MHKQREQLLVTKDDHAVIMGHIKSGLHRSTFNHQEAEALQAELKKALIVERDQLPEDVVCLNSTVTVNDEMAKRTIEITLVTPEKADIKRNKISILSPIGTALLGFRKGAKVAWKVPAGLKTFSILDVQNLPQPVKALTIS